MAGHPRVRVDPAYYTQGVCLLKHCFSLSKPGAAVAPPTSRVDTLIGTTLPPNQTAGSTIGLMNRDWVYAQPQRGRKSLVPLAAKLREGPYICVKIPSPSDLVFHLEELVKEQSHAERETSSEPRPAPVQCLMNAIQHKHGHIRSVVPVPFQQHTPDSIPIHPYQIQVPVPAPSNLTTNFSCSAQKSRPLSYASKGHVTPETGQRPQNSSNPSDKATPSQLSFVLLKLREELPAFFDGHHSFDMYAPDMTFENNLSKHAWKQRGRKNYRAFLSCSRMGLNSCYSGLQLDLLKITKEVEGGFIEARWRVRGRPRWAREERVVLEGFSTFVVRGDGRISIHRMDKVMPAAKERGRVLTWAMQLAVLLGLAPRTPAIDLEPQ